VAQPSQQAAPGIWRQVFAALSGSGAPLDAQLLPAAERLAALTSPALAAHLFGAQAGSSFNAAAAEASRLLTRFRRVSALRWVAAAAAAGIEVICLKGLGTAHLLYPDPDLRPMADADLLVRAGDYSRLLDLLRAGGFRSAGFDPTSPWGFIGDASFQPLISADRAVNIDLHIHPDAWPLHRGLDTAMVFAESRRCATGEGEIRLPAPDHMLLLTASHAARDLFQPYTVKSLIDAALLLQRHQAAIDWNRLTAVAAAGRTTRALKVTLALLARLGLDLPAVPRALQRRPAGLAGGEFERLVRTFEAVPGPAIDRPLAKLRREWLLTAGPDIALRRNLIRLRGLLRRKPGLPAARPGA